MEEGLICYFFNCSLKSDLDIQAVEIGLAFSRVIPQGLNILRIIGGILSAAVNNIPGLQVFHHPNKRPQCIYMAVVEILISNLIWNKHL